MILGMILFRKWISNKIIKSTEENEIRLDYKNRENNEIHILLKNNDVLNFYNKKKI